MHATPVSTFSVNKSSQTRFRRNCFIIYIFFFPSRYPGWSSSTAQMFWWIVQTRTEGPMFHCQRAACVSFSLIKTCSFSPFRLDGEKCLLEKFVFLYFTCLYFCSFDWLVGWVLGFRFVGLLVSWWVGYWSVSWLVVWWVSCWLVDWCGVVGWLVGRLVGVVGLLVGWLLVGWLGWCGVVVWSVSDFVGYFVKGKKIHVCMYILWLIRSSTFILL